MHVNWYATSIKALMGQLGKELYAKLDTGLSCSKKLWSEHIELNDIPKRRPVDKL
jgi:hypothetical protein